MLLSQQTQSTKPKTRVITPSAGNMGQGVAWIANYWNSHIESGSELSLVDEVLVIAPDHLPQSKKEAMERQGAKVIPVPFNTWWTVVDQAAFPHDSKKQDLPSHHYRNHPGVLEHLESEGHGEWKNVFVHPVFDTKVMAGNGTIGLEVVEDLPDLDTVVIPYGGGALACGIGATIRALLPDSKM